MEKERRINGDDYDRYEDKIVDGSSPSSDGSKIVIKLKIPNVLGSMEEGEKSSSKSTKEDETMSNNKRVCPECQKEFSSGKALGGHMRVHVQSAHKNTFLKPSKKSKQSSSYHDHDHLNNQNQNLNQEKRKPDYMRCVNDEGKPMCSLCGKIFPSKKSLYGHMRCHPDRLWKGILPPPSTTTGATTGLVPRRVLFDDKSKSNSSGSSSEINGNEEGSTNIVDLTQFVKGWSVTDRRGRRPALKEDDEVLLEAVGDLMNLANSDPSMAESESVVTQKQLRVDLEGSNSNNSLNKIDENLDLKLTDYGNGKGKDGNGKGKEVMEEDISPAKMEFIGLVGGGLTIKSFSDNESDSRNNLVQISYKQKKNPYKKRKKMKLMMELDHGGVFSGGSTPPPPLVLSMASPPASAESKYKCSTCNKCFATHQALGGHRSSHNKSKLNSTETCDQTIETDQVQDYESFLVNHSGQNVEFPGEITLTLGSISTVNIHQCKICDKNFPTGQALGGHKRCHWIGASTGEAAQALSSQVTSTGEAASQTGSDRKVLDFDLNEVPSTMIEEDEAGNGNGNASSSYNSNFFQ